MKNRVLLLLALLPVAILLALAIGPSGIAPEAILRGDLSETEWFILLDLRLPRVLAALLAGASLALAGTLFQALLRNPLADPYVLGVSGGAAAGVVFAEAIGIAVPIAGIPTTPLFALVGAAGVVGILFLLARTRGGLPVETMLLAGVALQSLLSAVILFVQTLLDPHSLVSVFVWLMGRVPSLEPAPLGLLAAGLGLALVLLLPRARDLNALTLGEADAMAVGVEVERTKHVVFFTASLLTGFVVSWMGLIGFVGILIPHIFRRIVGGDHLRLLPAAALGGGVFLLFADTIARTIGGTSEIPVGVLTAIVGAPFFLVLLHRRKSGGA